MKQIGITETYDPCFIPDWETKLLEANIIISKELTDEMIEKLLIVQDRVIFHHTVTGQGGTVYEPGVKPLEVEFEQFKKLIERGFPISHYVLRIDPILPFEEKCLERIYKAASLWSEYSADKIPQLRCRISMVDMYKHAQERFTEAGITTPFIKAFTQPCAAFQTVEKMLLENFASILRFECCAEHLFINDNIKKIGCASIEDLRILNADESEYCIPDVRQRFDCRCLSKKQILGVKPGRCPHNCLYCYWK